MVVGIWIANLRHPTVNGRQRDGAFLQLITGIAMMAILPGLHNSDPGTYGEPNYFKLGIKFAVGVAVAVLAVIGASRARKGVPVSGSIAHGVGGLGLLNIAIAVIWT
jgi:hypothetical protein